VAAFGQVVLHDVKTQHSDDLDSADFHVAEVERTGGLARARSDDLDSADSTEPRQPTDQSFRDEVLAGAGH